MCVCVCACKAILTNEKFNQCVKHAKRKTKTIIQEKKLYNTFSLSLNSFSLNVSLSFALVLFLHYLFFYLSRCCCCCCYLSVYPIHKVIGNHADEWTAPSTFIYPGLTRLTGKLNGLRGQLGDGGDGGWLWLNNIVCGAAMDSLARGHTRPLQL